MFRNFVRKLQNSSDNTKKIWLTILSGLTMAIVLAFWMMYVNLSIPRVSSVTPSLPSQQEKVLAKKVEDEAPGFFAIFSAGLKVIFDQIKERLAASKDIVVENLERNFVVEGVEPIPSTKLP